MRTASAATPRGRTSPRDRSPHRVAYSVSPAMAARRRPWCVARPRSACPRAARNGRGPGRQQLFFDEIAAPRWFARARPPRPTQCRRAAQPRLDAGPSDAGVGCDRSPAGPALRRPTATCCLVRGSRPRPSCLIGEREGGDGQRAVEPRLGAATDRGAARVPPTPAPAAGRPDAGRAARAPIARPRRRSILRVVGLLARRRQQRPGRLVVAAQLQLRQAQRVQARRGLAFAERLANLVGGQNETNGVGGSAILPPSRWLTQWGMWEPPGQPAKHRSFVPRSDKTHEPRVAIQSVASTSRARTGPRSRQPRPPACPPGFAGRCAEWPPRPIRRGACVAAMPRLFARPRPPPQRSEGTRQDGTPRVHARRGSAPVDVRRKHFRLQAAGVPAVPT